MHLKVLFWKPLVSHMSVGGTKRATVVLMAEKINTSSEKHYFLNSSSMRL